MSASNFDATDPETLFAFFGAQMKDTRSRLGTMMNDQETRNQRVQTLQKGSAALAAFQENPVNPASPQWPAFVDACKELKAVLGPGSEEIVKAIDLAITGVDHSKGPQPFMNAKSEADSNNGRVFDNNGKEVTTSDGTSDAKYFAKWNSAPGASAEVIKSIVNKVKAQSDGLQTESTMAMIRIQSLVEACSQITNLCSNVLKKLSDAQNTAIGNIR